MHRLLYRLRIIGPLKIGPRKTRTTPSIYANVPCRTKPVSNWRITRQKTWLACRKCSVANGSIFSCKPRPNPKSTRKETNKKGRSWIHKRGPSGTCTDLRQVVSIPLNLILRKFASSKTTHQQLMTSGKS